MRSLFLAGGSLVLIGVTALVGARTAGDSVRLRLRLVDADTGQGIGGIVRVKVKGEARPATLPGLYDRLRGLPKQEGQAGWYVVPAAGAETTLPRAVVEIEALSGLETALARRELDLAAGTREAVIPLRFLFRPEKLGLAAGNTHLHLRGARLEEADEYLRQIPPADGLKVLFLSYLERHKDDANYISNRYPIGDLKQFDDTGVRVSNGEEHRHNFEAFGQGYGHVMLLGIERLVPPVSIGPGITGGGFDEPALTPGILEARKQGGTIIWCHNTNGHEAVPNALAGRLDALNVFDGSRSGRYEDKYYRYLNVGLRLPISTGTDWFLYDFARVYARPTGPLSPRSWLEAVKAGRAVATNGPLLSLTVAGQQPGDVLSLERGKSVRVEARAIGRHDFGRLELVHNGTVSHAADCQAEGGGYGASLARDVAVDAPAWFAVRISTANRNELNQVLFAHSSPVYVDVAGQRVFDVESARALLRYLEEGEADIRTRGKFSSQDSAKKVLALYAQAAAHLRDQLNRRGK